MRRRIVLSAVAVLALALCRPASASVVVLRSDRDLVDTSRSVVVGVVERTSARIDRSTGLIQTVARFAVEQVIEGEQPGSEIDIAEWGGELDGRWLVASGAPRYRPGERCLVFLNRDRNGDWTTAAMSLGRFRLERDSRGRNVAIRDTADVVQLGSHDVDRPRLEEEFIGYIRDVGRGEDPPARYFAPESTSTSAPVLVEPDYTGSDYAMLLGGLPTRRDNAVVAWRIWGSQPGLDLPSAVSRGVSAWNSGGSPLISYSRSSQPATGSTVASDGESRIIGNDPNSVVTGSCVSGTCTVAVCFFGGGGTSSFNGETFLSLTTSDIVVNDGASVLGQAALDTAITHEMGHSLGFRHSDRTADESAGCASPLPCSTTAIMNSYVVPGIGSTLQPWDIDAVRTLYGSAGICSGAAITASPKSVTVIAGSSTTLTVSVAGTSPVAVQWYRGIRYDTTTPVGNALSYSTGPLSSSASYWVRATNSCGTSDSDTVTVTVCYPPEITSQPAGASIRAGQTATLSLGVSGASAIQWYRGATGDTSNPLVGATSNVLVTPPLLVTTLFWARASNGCSSVNSASARVDVCVTPQIVLQPQNETVKRGDTATLSVTQTGSEPVTVSWFQGSAPDDSRQVGSGNPFVTPAITTTTTFWAKVVNGCGSASSQNATIFVAEECVAPSITRQPSGQNVAIGGSAVLSVAASGTGLGYQWYQGASGDRTTPVGINSSAFVTPSLAATTSFWVRIWNACGERNSATAVVTVMACEAPRIVIQPASTTIDSSSRATLFVSAEGGEPLSYQWFEGTRGDISYPLPGNSPSFTTPVLVRTTDYWVRVSNSCSSADSATANVLVLGGHPRTRVIKRK